MHPQFRQFLMRGWSASVSDTGRKREGVDCAVHQLSEGGVHHLVLIDSRFTAELGRDDDGLEVVLRSREVRNVDPRAGKSFEKAGTDGLGVRHVSSSGTSN
jgi:hypothetical protein